MKKDLILLFRSGLFRRAFWAMVFLSLSIGISYAQKIELSGKVLDENKEPLAGVSVINKTKNTGSMTDVDGNFKVTVDRNEVLLFKFLGYEDQEHIITTQKILSIQMQPTTIGMSDVVVIGYGTQKRSHVAGATTSLNPDSQKLDEIPADGLDRLLQGRLAGVTIQDTEGQVGLDAVIRIRGNASFSASSDPLIIIDGLPTKGSINDVQVNDIETIDVLKDAASTAIYGSRGANGVILITTKQGVEEKTRFNVKISTGITDVYKYYDTFGLEEYAERYYRTNILYPWETQYLKRGMEIPNGINEDGSFNSGPDKKNFLPYDKYFTTELNPATKTVYNKYGAGYAQLSRMNALANAKDPQESITRTGHSYKASISAQGGSKKIKYYVSANLSKESGVMINNNLESVAVTTNLSAQLNDRIKIDVKLNPQFRRTRVSTGTQLGGALRWLTHPLTYDERVLAAARKTGNGGAVPIWAEIGDYAKSRDFREMWLMNDDFTEYILDSKGKQIPVGTYSGTGDITSYGIAMGTKDIRKQYTLNGNLGIDINIIKGMVFRTTVGASFKQNNTSLWKSSLINSKGAMKTDNGSASYGQSSYVNIVNENTLNYRFDVNDHSFDFLAGFSVESMNTESLNAAGLLFTSENIHMLNYAGQLDANNTKSNIIEETLLSMFGRVNYSYKDRYILSGLVRRDGSSQFGSDRHWGNFPSISAAWRISEESFMKKYNWLSELKLRASYGVTGNNAIPRYSYITAVNKVLYPIEGGDAQGYAPSNTSKGNDDLGWEETNAANIGLTASFLKNRFTLNVDMYKNKTKALLLNTPIPHITGHTTEWANVGKMQNTGLEIEASARIIDNKKFRWSVQGTFSQNRNKLIDYGDAQEAFFSGYNESIYRLKVGRPVGEYFGYKTNGEIWNSQAELDEAKAKNLAFASTTLGELKLMDTNGDGIITEDDRTHLGKSTPDFEWGLSNSFQIHDFDVNFMVQGSHGAKVWNMTNVYGGNYLHYMQDDVYVDEFHGSTPMHSKNSITSTDYLIEDASYIALRSVTIGYRIPKTKIRIYAAGRNLLYFMSNKYNGINPEFRANISGALITGEQRMTVVPLMRTFSAGINITF